MNKLSDQKDPHEYMKRFSDSELIPDLAEAATDAGYCRVALMMGIKKLDDGSNIEDRYKSNLETIRKISDELSFRARTQESMVTYGWYGEDDEKKTLLSWLSRGRMPRAYSVLDLKELEIEDTPDEDNWLQEQKGPLRPESREPFEEAE